MSRWKLFSAIGIEIEYMVVDRDSLAVRPIVDRVLASAAGGVITSDVERGAIDWSNELVAHVIELKTAGPAPALDESLLAAFDREVRVIDSMLASHGARLLPGAMHPLMDPLRETVLWPHDYSPVYQAYDRIFGCQGHGWSNLQSLHLNFPFADDEEFGRLHAAIRLLLPLLPALAASSPVVEGRVGDLLDHRLEFYRTNSRRIPSIAGEIVPEPIFDRATYEREIFERLYRDIAPHDPEGVLRDQFLNARGAIARFDRGAIEIRVIDVQECPRADLAIAAAARAVLLLTTRERWSDQAIQRGVATAPLAALLRAAAKDGAAAVIEDPSILQAWGVSSSSVSVGELWRRLLEEARSEIGSPWEGVLDQILRQGSLAERLRRLLGPTPDRATLLDVYHRLADCLHHGELLRA